MNRGKGCPSFKDRINDLFFPDYVMKYLVMLRKEEYYSGNKSLSWLRLINKMRFQRLGMKLGFSISANVFGYGLVIPHYGTIVVGAGNVVGNYAVLHTSTCITAGKKIIVNAMYLSSGSKIINYITLGDGISISANTLVNKPVNQSNVLIAGCPAVIMKLTVPWYIRDGEEYERRVNEVEAIRNHLWST